MAGCTCRSTGPGVVLIGGTGVEITGAGTPASPFKIDSATLGAPIIEVRDSTTVNMSITGSGSEDDPYQIRADTSSAAALVNLSDVLSDPPQAGAVPTWVASTSTTPGHWEFRVPVVVTQGGGGGSPTPITSVATSILSGTLMDQTLPGRLQRVALLLNQGYDVNNLIESGGYRGTGLANAPGNGWYYYDVIGHDGQYTYQRASNYFAPYDEYERRKDAGVWKPWRKLAFEDVLLNGLLDNRYAGTGISNIDTGAGSVASGWTLNRFILKKVNHVVSLDISVTRTGGDIGSSTTGNITNVLIGNVGSWRPLTPWAPLAPGPGGILASYAIDGNGNLYLCALPPGRVGSNNTEFSCGGSYVTAA